MEHIKPFLHKIIWTEKTGMKMAKLTSILFYIASLLFFIAGFIRMKYGCYTAGRIENTYLYSPAMRGCVGSYKA